MDPGKVHVFIVGLIYFFDVIEPSQVTKDHHDD